PHVQRIAQHFFAADKPVAQICHGPLIPAAAGLLDGRRSSAYPALAPDLKAAGAEFVDGEAVVDGLVVSARAWPDHPAWLRAFLDILRDKAPLS
ncbi:DJ-1/PfpI family protein, partial [Streptomyces rubellomurinus]